MKPIVLLVSLAASAACKFPYPADVEPLDATTDAPSSSGHVGGTLSGMWQGGVAKLRLVSGDVDEVLDIDARGAFQFAGTVETGDSYTVTVAEAPMRHRCTVTMGTGTVPGTGVDDVAVRCTIDIALSVTTSLPFDWTFDPTVDEHSFMTSLVVQGLTVRVDLAEATTIAVNGQPLASGAPSSPIPLTPGMNDVALAVTVGALSNTYHLRVDRGAVPPSQLTYGKASNAGADDRLGYGVGFFAYGQAPVAVDGAWMVVGAPNEDSTPGAPQSDTLSNSGAAYVYVRQGSRWTPAGMLKAPNAGVDDTFGGGVAISGDLLAVAAVNEDSASRAINGDQTSNAASNAGAVYIYRRNGGAWVFDAYIKAPNADAIDHFGTAIALDGTTLVVGAPGEASGSMANQADNAMGNAGAAYVFSRAGGTWAFRRYLKAPRPRANMQFGITVDVAGDRIAVGAPNESGNSTGINGDDSVLTVSASGAAYVFRLVGLNWEQEAYVKAPNAEANDFFGTAVELSRERLLVGARGEDSAATGVGGNMNDNSASNSGAAYVFSRTSGTWRFEAYVKSTNAKAGDFEVSMKLHWGLLGDLLALGVDTEDSNARGIGGDQTNTSGTDSGAVFLYHHDGQQWSPYAYVKASNSDAGDAFGHGTTLSLDGMAVVAPWESSSATMIDGDQTSNAAPGAGAFYVFR